MDLILATDWINNAYSEINTKEKAPPKDEEEDSWLRIIDEEQVEKTPIDEEQKPVEKPKPEYVCAISRKTVPLVEHLCSKFSCTDTELHVLLKTLEHRRPIVDYLRTVQLRTAHLNPPIRNFAVRCNDLSILDAHSSPAYRGYLGITVRMHYYIKQGIRLRHPNLPCVVEFGGGDHKTFFPLEVLSIVIKD